MRTGHFVHDCAWPAADAGSQCTDSDQCQGVCELPERMFDRTSSAGVVVLRLKADEPRPIIGVCSSFRNRAKPLNCTIHLREGEVTAESCAE